MKCLREAIGRDKDPTLNPSYVQVMKHVRERRNRRAGYIRDNLKQWEIDNCRMEKRGMLFLFTSII